jgi:hypothetical protein
MADKDELKRAYYDPGLPWTYGGVAGLQRSIKFNPKTIKEWLSLQDTYTLHKPIRRKFKRRLTITCGIDHQFQVDLIDVRGLQKYINGYGYLVTCINMFSKYAWAVPIKTKGAEEALTRDEVPGPGNILDKILPSPSRGAPGQRSLT